MDSLTAQELLLEATEEMAISMGMVGVGVCLIIDPDDDSNILEPSIIIVTRFNDGQGPWRSVMAQEANFLAIAFAKFAQMLCTWKDSGEAFVIEGENGYRGGLITEVAGRKVLVAFSGGSEKQDLAVAKYGVQSLTDDVLVRPWD